MTMQHRFVTSAACLLMVLGGLRSAQAVDVYSQDFESLSLFSDSSGPGSYVVVEDAGGSAWQIQGGDGSPGGVPGIKLTAGIDNNGVGGSKSLFANWDFSPNNAEQHGWYTWNQHTIYGLAGLASGTMLSDVTVSLDIYMEGSSINNPIWINFQGNGGTRTFRPALANGQYTHVSFTLDQATGGTPNLTLPFNLQLTYGAGDGFGFDADNVIRIDNVSIANAIEPLVPEPSTCVLLALGGLGLLAGRRRG